jgi:hypothetical protein
MGKMWHRLLCSALGASSGLTGFISVSGCSGSACPSCFGCAGVGVGAALIVLFGLKKRKAKEIGHGMA